MGEMGFNRPDIKSLLPQELEKIFERIGIPKYRAGQVFSWLAKGAGDFSEMTDIPEKLRNELSEDFCIKGAKTEVKRVSVDGTVKYLFSLYDGETVESVLMEYHHGNSVCISTQVGCKMGCDFCATGKSGFSRNLSASEILSQVQMVAQDSGKKISSIVLMGMGEPLDNYENVLRFLTLVTNPKGMNVGMRHISLSTCGLVDKIYELAKLKLQLTLSVSLHAPNDEIRAMTMPIARRYSIDELLKACRYYAEMTGRRISFEYAMISGLNDSPACARELAGRLRGMLAHVNLIPINKVSGAPYQKSGEKQLAVFSQILKSSGIPCTVRRTLGSDIEASCGQLRRRHGG